MTISRGLHLRLNSAICTAICITLSTFSQPPKENKSLTSDIEYGTDATGEVPNPDLVEKATPIETIKSPIRNSKYCLIALIILSRFIYNPFITIDDSAV